MEKVIGLAFTLKGPACAMTRHSCVKGAGGLVVEGVVEEVAVLGLVAGSLVAVGMVGGCVRKRCGSCR